MAGALGAGDADYGWFSPEDFQFLVERLRRLDERETIVLVGGQAVTAWALYYGIEVPKTDAPYLTQDADFHGTRLAAEHLAEVLGGTARLPGPDDHTINTGTVVFHSPTTGDKLLVDVLHHVHGLKPEEIQKLAVPVGLMGGQINLLHPLLSLESRIKNLADLAHKRTPEGIAQARVALQAAQAFVDRIEDQRPLLKAYTRLADLAESPAGVKVFLAHRIDPLSIVDVARIENPNFGERSWPDRVTEIERKREIASRRVPKA